jgi:hypothetical protein
MRLRHTITCTSIGRGHVERSVDVAHTVLESLHAVEHSLVTEDGRTVTDIALRSGEHLRPGARYGLLDHEGQAVDVELLSWDRRVETGARVEIAEPRQTAPGGGRAAGGRMTCAVRLHSAERPERPERAELSLHGAMTGPDGRRRRLRWFTLGGELDLTRWWEAAGGAADGPALTVRARHPVLRVAVRAGPRPGPDGTWLIDVETMLRGRGLARPVAAVPLLVTRRMLHRALGQALERLAKDWGTEAVPEMRREPGDLRRRMLDELCAPREAGPAEGA